MLQEDIPRVMEIENQSFTGSDKWDAQVYADQLKEYGAFYWVWEKLADQKVYAYIGYWEEGSRIHINKLAVAPEKRDGGVGSYLISFVADLCRTHSIAIMFLECRAANNRLRLFYQNCGFVPYRFEENYYGDPTDDAVLFYYNVNGRKK